MSRSRKAADAPLKKGTIAHTLAVVANGGKLTRERVYPYPPKMILRWQEGEKQQQHELSESHVIRLLSDKLIEPAKHDITKSPDCIQYFITQRGVEKAGERAA